MSITLTGSTDIRFRDTSFRWISSKYFTPQKDASDAALLSHMIAHPAYADGYIGGSFGRSGHHGPYRSACITPSDYLRLDASAAIAWLDEFCSLFDSAPSSALARDIDAVVRQRITRADAVFRLRDLGASARHSLSEILDEFRELVTIRRDPPELTLLVLGID